MKKESLIGHVIEVFSAFAERSNIPADAILRDFYLKRKYLGSSDRREIAVPYYGIVKNYLRLESIYVDSTGLDELFPELIVAAYYLVYENASPIELQRIIKELANEFQYDHPIEFFEKMADRDRETARLASLAEDERSSILYSMPLWFVKKLRSEFADEANEILKSSNQEAPTSLRVNTLVTSREEVMAYLQSKGTECTASALAPEAILLRKRINAMEHDLFRKGGFEIQDEGSQLIPHFANITSPRIKVFDACAGAGGKTLHFSSLMHNHGEIYSTDIDARKLEELKKRTKRATAQNIRIILPQDREKFLSNKLNTFDIVLLDVPCTGTGTLRRNPSIKWNLTEDMLASLIEKQRGIVAENIRFVKPGGVLLYATCSLLKDECEEQIQWILSEFGEFTLEAEKRTRPDKDGCDGFYVARLRKKTT
jgi:16S rRNA (cytosine967-C5)-methyltransferase